MVTMDADIRRLYHQYFDMLEGGVLVILADGSERIVFASERRYARCLEVKAMILNPLF